MPINIFGNSSNNNDNKIDTSLFVQKPYLRIKYVESKIEEDIDLKNQFGIKILPDPISNRELASKNYVDNFFNDPAIVKNNAHKYLNDRNITNARFIQVNQMHRNDSHLTAKLYVDISIDEPTLVRNNQDNDFNDNKITNLDSVEIRRDPTSDNELTNKIYVDNAVYQTSLVRNNKENDFSNYNLTNIISITLKKQAENDNEVITKAYVDQIHNDKEGNRRDL